MASYLVNDMEEAAFLSSGITCRRHCPASYVPHPRARLAALAGNVAENTVVPTDARVRVNLAVVVLV